MDKRGAARKGFNVIEFCVILLILGFLAALVAPQFTQAGLGSRDQQLDDALLTLQSQFNLYRVQHEGLYPWQNKDGTCDLSKIEERMTRPTNTQHECDKADSAFGPYIHDLPQNPYMVDGQVVFSTTEEIGVDWVIDPATHRVRDGRPEGGILGR